MQTYMTSQKAFIALMFCLKLNVNFFVHYGSITYQKWNGDFLYNVYLNGLLNAIKTDFFASIDDGGLFHVEATTVISGLSH